MKSVIRKALAKDTPAEIRSALRKESLNMHPDKTPPGPHMDLEHEVRHRVMQRFNVEKDADFAKI